jgi:PAS domain S-box-containing protein
MAPEKQHVPSTSPETSSTRQARDVTWQITPDLLSVVNAEARFDAINPAWHTTLGWSEQEILAKASMELIHPDDLAATTLALQKLQQGQPVLRHDNRYRHKDGGYRWLSWLCVPDDDKIYCSARDISAEKEQAARLADRTAERDQLWALSTDIMLRCRFDGTIATVNPAWTELLGWTEAELVGKTIFDFLHPDDIAATNEGARVSADGHSLSRFDNRYRHKDGSYRWITWSTRPDASMINAVGRDFTAEKHNADALAAAEAALRQAQKMEAVGQLTGGLAHDFNNLLTGITGSLQLIQIRVGQGRVGELNKYVNAAMGAAKRATALTHRLLAFSRRQTLDPKATDINRLVQGMEDMIRRTVGPAITVETVGAAGLWNTLVDPGQLENALLNLCINARDALPDGGRLTIETANRRFDERTGAERELAPGNYVSLSVTDNGTGMAPEVMARAFEPFFTTKPLGMGTGLGLSMIYGFAQQSGGQVRIYSEPGLGSTVCLYLPRNAAGADGDMGGDALLPASPPPNGAGKTVMIVDDEATVRMLLTEVLSDLGYTSLEAEDGPSALRVLQSDARIDLLVTDVGLPNGMNGRQVADAARALRAGIKVLFITGYAENAVLSHGNLEAGMQVLTKPFTLDVLAHRISDMINAPPPA